MEREKIHVTVTEDYTTSYANSPVKFELRSEKFN